MSAAATPTHPVTPAEEVPAEASMRAVVGERYGSPDVLELRTIARPTIGPDEVLVRVHAAGVSRGALHLMTGTPYAIRLAGFGVRAPKQPVPGLEVAGTVEAVGAEVTRFRPGDEVFGMGRGTFAEFARVSEAKLAPKPASLTFAEAAAMPDSASTALQAVRDHGTVAAGQRVLVIGASGGVGGYAVQIAKALGAEITGVCRTDKVDLVRSFGADRVIDRTAQDPTALDAGDARYDVIIDIGGNTPVRRLRRALAPRGTLVIVGGEEGGPLTGGLNRQLGAMLRSLVGRQTLKTFVAKESHEHLEALTALVDAGSVRPSIDRTYPLAEAADALRRLESGDARGKLVIEVV